MAKRTLVQISASLGVASNNLIHRRSTELNPVLPHLSRAIEALQKIIKQKKRRQ